MISLRRRRILTTAASVAAVAPFAGLAGCGDSSSGGGPQPVPPSEVALRMPDDMYLHPGAPTEWWWHMGTLRAGERIFGFEITAAYFAKLGFGFSQLMLTDVATQRHFKRTTPFVPPLMLDPNHWAQGDITQDWYARLGDPANQLSALQLENAGSGYTSDPQVQITGGGGSGAIGLAVHDPATGRIVTVGLVSAGSGYTSPPSVTLVGGGGSGATARAFHSFVTMDSPAADPTQNMRVRALLCDDPSFEQIAFDLVMSQQGRPFFVWGTGINRGGGSGGLQDDNFYFSLTRLMASGTITYGGETFDVEGMTWMDHQYGKFGEGTGIVRWILQDMQLDNGWCISNYVTHDGELPPFGEPQDAIATVQGPDGALYLVPTRMTAVGRTWTSPETGSTYFMEFRVEIPAFDADLHVDTLVDSQEFPVPGASVYEGVAVAEGTFRGKRVRGTAWNEQEL